VATDSVTNLQNRARGAESLLVEIGSRDGALESAIVVSRLQQIPGVSRAQLKTVHGERNVYEVEGQKGFKRGELARAVVQAGWDLNELRPAAVSLEEIFLQLTRADAASKGAA